MNFLRTHSKRFEHAGNNVSTVGLPVSKRHAAEDWALDHGLFLALAACFVFWVALGAVLSDLF